MSGKRVRRRNEVKERFWRRTVAEHQRSGLTIREFCARRGFSEPSFYAWRRELAQRDGRARQKAPPPVAEANATPRFVSLKLAAEPATPVMIEIVTRGGHTLRVPPGVDRQTLADVWAVLESQPC
jgi:transposase-like protein